MNTKTTLKTIVLATAVALFAGISNDAEAQSTRKKLDRAEDVADRREDVADRKEKPPRPQRGSQR